jgi:transcriptional regulator GlxA family with amidase domain
MDYVIARPNADLSSTALAQVASVSPRQLSRLFRSQLGETPAAAVRRVRLELAARMLAGTDRSISDVARRCGFSSAESLRQAFRAHHGVSPKSFRDDKGAELRERTRP